MMKKLMSTLRNAANAAVSFLRSPVPASAAQAVLDHGLWVSGLALISAGVFLANPIAGFIVTGGLVLVLNERLSV